MFPFFSAAVLIICGAGMLIKPGDQEDDRRFDKTAWLRLALIFGIVMVYCIAMVYLGFFVPTLVLLFILSTMFSADAPVPWWQRLLFAVLLTVLIYLLFSKVLNLKLPDMQFL